MSLKLLHIFICVALFFFVLVRANAHFDYTSFGGPYAYGEYYEYNTDWFIDCDGIVTIFDHTKITLVQDCSDY